jgi:PAS domain S-box-containing protein
VEHYDTAIVRKDGRRVDVEVGVKTLRIDDRTKLVFVVRDITERKRAQQQLQDILDNTTAAVYAKDLQGRYILVNNRCAPLMEMGRERMLGKTDHELLSKEEADALRANDQRVLATGDPLEFEEAFRLNGGRRVYLTSKFLLRDQDGAPYALCGVSTDITERRQAVAQRCERARRATARSSRTRPS